jgi:hypothetical protein
MTLNHGAGGRSGNSLDVGTGRPRFEYVREPAHPDSEKFEGFHECGR